MKTKKSGLGIIQLWIIMLLLLSMLPIQGVILDTGVDIEIENETYRVNAAMNFSRIVITDTYPIFNNTGFNTTSTNNILIILFYINQSTTIASPGDKLVEIRTVLISDSSILKISGFKGNTNYEVFEDDVTQGNYLSDTDGNITLTINPIIGIDYRIHEKSDANTAPVISSPFPQDGATGVSIAGSPININIVDADGQTMNTSMWSNYTGTWTQYAGRDLLSITGDNSNASILDRFNDGLFDIGDYTSYIDDGWQSDGWRGFYENVPGNNMSVTDNWGMTTLNTTYYWSVNCTDGEDWTNETYSFTTVANTAPTISNPSPNDGATDVDKDTATLSVNIADVEGTFDWTITTDPNIGSSNANDASSGTKTCSVSGLSYDAHYFWTVTSYDGEYWTNSTYDFTVEEGGDENSAPVISNPYPSDESTGQDITPYCSVLVTDADLETVTVNFYNSTDGSSWTHQQTNVSIQPGGTIRWEYSDATEYNTLYYWKVTANDGTINISQIYSFTTFDNAPVITGNYPTDGATAITRNETLSVSIYDRQGHTMNITWRNRNNADNIWYDFAWNKTLTNGTYTQPNVNSTNFSTLYYWSVNITDGYTWTNATYSYTTEGKYDYVFRNIYPINQSTLYTGVINLYPRITISDNKGTDFTWWINTTNGDRWTGSGSSSYIIDSDDYVMENLDINTVYWWNITVDNYIGNRTTRQYWFKTGGQTMFDELQDDFIYFSFQGYETVFGMFFFPILFLVVIGYVYLKQQSVVAAAVAAIIMFAMTAAFDIVVIPQPIVILVQIVVALAFTGLIILWVARRRSGG